MNQIAGQDNGEAKHKICVMATETNFPVLQQALAKPNEVRQANNTQQIKEHLQECLRDNSYSLFVLYLSETDMMQSFDNFFGTLECVFEIENRRF